VSCSGVVKCCERYEFVAVVAIAVADAVAVVDVTNDMSLYY